MISIILFCYLLLYGATNNITILIEDIRDISDYIIRLNSSW